MTFPEWGPWGGEWKWSLPNGESYTHRVRYRREHPADAAICQWRALPWYVRLWEWVRLP
jgi:hypothetical protein